MRRFLPSWSVRCLCVLILFHGVMAYSLAAARSGNYYAAIAYSERTKKWGFSEKCTDKEEAFKNARKECKAGDAKVVVWSSNDTYCALALSPNGAFGCATGANEKEARKAAHANCRKFGKRATVVVCVRGGP